MRDQPVHIVFAVVFNATIGPLNDGARVVAIEKNELLEIIKGSKVLQVLISYQKFSTWPSGRISILKKNDLDV